MGVEGRGELGGGGGGRVSDFFTKNPNLKEKKYLFWGRGVGVGGGGYSKRFLLRIQFKNKKKNKLFCFFGVRGGRLEGAGVSAYFYYESKLK